VKREQDKLWESAFVVGGRVFGYTNVPTSEQDPKSRKIIRRSRRELDPVEAPVVRRIFELIASGRSFKDVAAILRHEHAASPRDRGWTRAGVKKIAQRSDYVGIERRGATKRIRREDHEGKTRWFQVANDNIRERPSPAIVSQEIWDAVQAKLEGNRARKAKHAPKTGVASKNFNLLSGLTVCARCGGPMTILNFKASAKAEPVKQLVCSNNHRRGAQGDIVQGGRYCDSSLRVDYNDLELAVMAQFTGKNLTHLIEDFYQAEQDRRSQGAVELERKALGTELASLTKQVANLAAAIKLGGDLPVLVSELADASARREKVQGRLDGLELPPLDWEPSWFYPADPSLNDDDYEDSSMVNLIEMYRSDVDRARSYLQAYLRGSKLLLTPKDGGFTVTATAAPSVLVANLIAVRKGSSEVVHNLGSSAG
jgi:hypothetical protein